MCTKPQFRISSDIYLLLWRYVDYVDFTFADWVEYRKRDHIKLNHGMASNALEQALCEDTNKEYEED